MSIDPLIPLPALERVRAEVLRRIEKLQPPLAFDVRPGELGDALTHALLFERWPELVGDGEPVDRKRLVYNHYFWFVRFLVLSQKQHGYDAGIEQQAFQILERADDELDWELVRALDARARTTSTSSSAP